MKHVKIITPAQGIKEFDETNVPKLFYTYHFYDDGKSSLSRHYYATVIEVIPYSSMKKLPRYRKIFKTWKRQLKEHYWVFAPTTDYFIIAEVPFYCEYPLCFARTKPGGWFSLELVDEDFFCGGILDTDNKHTNRILEYDPKYTERCKDIAIERLMERITNKYYENLIDEYEEE